MTTYRTGNHWSTTIIETGTQPASADGTRADDRLVAVVLRDDAHLAEVICRLLNTEKCEQTGLHDCGGLFRDHEQDARAHLRHLAAALGYALCPEVPEA